MATRFRIRTLSVIAAGLVAIATASPAAARLIRTTTVTTAEEPYLIVNCDGTEIRVEPEGQIATTVFRDENGAVVQEAVVFIGYVDEPRNRCIDHRAALRIFDLRLQHRRFEHVCPDRFMAP